MQSFVQFIHELRRRGVADFPQSRYNVVRPSAKKSPSQTNKPFPRVGFHSSPITRGNGSAPAPLPCPLAEAEENPGSPRARHPSKRGSAVVEEGLGKP